MHRLSSDLFCSYPLPTLSFLCCLLATCSFVFISPDLHLFLPSMCCLSPSASRLIHDVVSDVLFACVHSSLCFSLLREDGVLYVRLMIHLYSQRGLKQLSSSVCRFLSRPVFAMVSFAAARSSVASVSPPSCFETSSGASTSLLAVLSTCCGLLENILGLVAVWGGSPGKAQQAEGAACYLQKTNPSP